VQQGYTELALRNPKRIVRVDASLSEAVVQEQIQAILSQRLTKWYDEFFAQLVGQHQAVELLTQAVKQERVAPA